MGKPVVGYEERGEFISVFVLVPPRKNGLPNMAAVQAAMMLLENTFRPEAYDPPEPVSEAMARAAVRDGLPLRWMGTSGKRYATRDDAIASGESAISEDAMTWIVVDGDDAIPGYRCANGACTGD